MLGTLRLILALCVAASHAGFYPGGLNPGVAAVIGFYLISGYVMTGLLTRHYPDRPHIPAFYIDRGVRILPQYLLYASITLIWQLASNQRTAFLQASPGTTDLINNLLIVPLNYYMVNGADRYTLIPPAWSLGAEMQFYLIAPLLLLSTRRILVAGGFSLTVFALAVIGVLDSDWYGYRLLPGVLLFFLLGALLFHLHRCQKQKAANVLITAAVTAAVTAAIALQQAALLFRPYNQEILIGLCLAFPLLHLLVQRKRHALDDWLGDLSFGVFLNHFFVLWVLYPHGVSPQHLPVFLAVSLVLSILSQRYIERPLLRWRTRLRKPSARPRHEQTPPSGKSHFYKPIQ